jgi:hypothetical protein
MKYTAANNGHCFATMAFDSGTLNALSIIFIVAVQALIKNQYFSVSAFAQNDALALTVKDDTLKTTNVQTK